jgi:hypothetical protein
MLTPSYGRCAMPLIIVGCGMPIASRIVGAMSMMELVAHAAGVLVQIVGRRFREDMILDAAEAVERQVGIMAQRLWARA